MNLLQAAFLQAPVNYGIPANPFTWNQAVVPYDGDTVIAHEVLGVSTPTSSGYPVLDQYAPFNKMLASGYYIGFCNQIIVQVVAPATVNPVPQNENQDDLWTVVFGYLNGIVDLLGRKLGFVST